MNKSMGVYTIYDAIHSDNQDKHRFQSSIKLFSYNQDIPIAMNIDSNKLYSAQQAQYGLDKLFNKVLSCHPPKTHSKFTCVLRSLSTSTLHTKMQKYFKNNCCEYI